MDYSKEIEEIKLENKRTNIDFDMQLKPEARQYAEVIYVLMRYYREDLTTDTVTIYANNLCDIPMNDLKRVAGAFMQDPNNKKVPLPSVLRAMLNPRGSYEAEAENIMGRIWRLIGKKGHNWAWGKEPGEFRKLLVSEIGEIGCIVVDRFGGWERLAMDETDSGILRAQIRKMAASVLEMAENGRLDDVPELPAAKIPKAIKQVVAGALENKQE